LRRNWGVGVLRRFRALDEIHSSTRNAPTLEKEQLFWSVCESVGDEQSVLAGEI
jgi:hypothetical protein